LAAGPGEGDHGASTIAVDPDADGDGVEGAADLCPHEAGLEPDGCPLRDDDGDGILNPEDRCPDACEVINGVDDEDGCPDPNPGDAPEIQALLGPIEGLSFEVNREHIRPSSYPVLDGIAATLARHPQVLIAVEGHRDSGAARDYSRGQITRRRASAVMDYLVMKGIARARLEAISYGPERPIESNKTAAGRAKNRRVELTLRNPEPSTAPGCTR